MKELIKHAVTGMFGSGKMEKRIVFESNPDLADNAWPVFKQLLDQGFDSEYELSWLVREPEKYADAFEGRNVTFFGYDPASKSSRLNAAKYLLHSRCVVFCNKTVWEPREGQLSLFLGHGTPIKACKGIYTPGGFCNRWACPSENVQCIMEQQFGLHGEQALLLGYPRNDVLTKPFGALDKVIDRRGKKAIFWLPTFRQHTLSSDCNYALPGCGLPLLGDEGALERLDAALKKNNVLLILKPHPAQDMSAIHAKAMENFLIINDGMLEKSGVRLYEALADADALITDYSSVYCDYLITGKPIGLTFDDIEQYSTSRGFVFDPVTDVLKGRKMTCEADLMDFVSELASGSDTHAAEREGARAFFNEYTSGATERATAYIKKFLSENFVAEE